MIDERDQETVGWLAEHTGLDLAEVEKGLETGRLRRHAVVFELVDAGLAGRELVEMVVALTGLPPVEARELIAEEAPGVDLES